MRERGQQGSNLARRPRSRTRMRRVEGETAFGLPKPLKRENTRPSAGSVV